MDERLVSWARAVKARQARLGHHHPVLWLFTDAERLPDPLPAIARLPRFLSGVVFRHDGVPGRAELAGQVASLCHCRGIPLSIAGDPRRAARLRTGTHLRARLPHPLPARALTGSAHSVAELQRLSRCLVPVCFLGPVFLTASHPGLRALGVVRWSAIARSSRGRSSRAPSSGAGVVLALGGVDGRSARRLPRWCAGAGAIGALT